jgi:hypothetical protein
LGVGKAWVERACAEQGVPVNSDPVALRHRDILGEARAAREATRKNRRKA